MMPFYSTDRSLFVSETALLPNYMKPLSVSTPNPLTGIIISGK